ncbi:MAG TPA: response regulator [Bacteroidia bacterium]|nr:response regulator [Bacteroidia bacterium]HRS58740.1 response regulator [Bacteroidia bacterium]HRU67926.1 response regulator [Bacteroidia bacterium]
MNTLRILIIDDDRIDALSIKKSLMQSEAYLSIDYALDATTALQMLEKEEFDCIFSDLKLPDIDGITLMKTIREKGIKIPVVILTSYGDERVAAEAIRAGASDYIPKSLISPEGLSMSLRNALKNYETEKKRQEIEQALVRSEMRLKEAQKLAHIGSFEYHTETRELIMTEEGQKIFSLSPEDVSFSHFLKQIHKDDYSAVMQALDMAIKTAEPQDIDFRINTPTGHKFINTRLFVSNPDNGNSYTVLGTIQDITERKKIEAELRRSKEIAEESLAMRERFLANISHEIRTPMNGIIGLTNILLGMETNQEKIDYLKAIKSSGDNLLVIINDLLDLAKIQSGKIKFEEIDFDLYDQLSTTLKILRVKAEEKNISLNFDFDDNIAKSLKGDYYRLNQVIVNLIGNAIKFTEKGEVRLKVNLLHEESGKQYLQFDVSDSGIGIPENKIAYIFETFTQATTDTERKYGGTGLGLSICKQLVELQGGKIWVKSKVGVGSTFSFTLGFKVNTNAVKKEEETVIKSVKEEDWTNYHVLLVEDNKINQLLALKVLKNWGLNIDVAENGKIATEMVRKKSYDIILMDLQMPVMNGYEATKVIREEFNLKIPIIAMTASAMRDELESCIYQGMNDYITKPFQPNELYNLLDHWFKTKDKMQMAIGFK